jgi:tetratricopeptide (TPR) repeat protein
MGSREQLFASVIVAVEAPGPALAHAAERTRAVASKFGASVDARPDGTIAVTVPSAGSARDRARKAARCALAVRDVLGDGAIALATSQAAEGSASAVDVALAMARSAPPFKDASGRARPIAIDATTAGLLDPRFEIVGHEGQLGLRRLRASADAEAPRTLLGRPAPFFGREREMATLEAVLRGLLDDELAHVVLLTGPSGIGKSRLRREFAQLVQKEHDEVEIWLARGDPMSAGSPLGMLAQVVRATAGTLESDSLRTCQAKLAARVSRLLAGDDATRVTEFLGELAGIRFPEAKSPQLRAARRSHVLMGDQMRRAWEDFLAAECRAQPVLLVLEDLHWGDLPTVSFLDGALRNLRETPLMLLALGHPDVHTVFPRLWSGHALTEIHLAELSRKASERIARAALGPDVPEDAVARIVTQATGNAFYLEELIRSVAGGAVEVPQTLLAMVESRLAALDPMARLVLRAASVFGTSFWKGGVIALLDTAGDHQVSAVLQELERQELVVAREAGRFADEYAFRHSLVRDVSYAAWTEEDRRMAHRRAGEWLERVGESDAMVLAEQFERGKEPQRAIASYERAAAQALDGNDYPGAIERAAKAISCGATGPVLGALLALQAEAHRWTGDFNAAVDCLERGAALLPAGESRWYDAKSELLAARVRAGRTDDLEPLVALLADTAPVADARAAQLVAWSRAAVSLAFAGAHSAAEGLLSLIESATFDISDRQVLARVHQARATRAMAAGDLGAYLEHTLACADALDASGDVRTACVQRNNAGYALTLLGALDEAEARLREALVSAERMGMKSAAGVARQNLGLTLAYRGALYEARAVEERGIEAAEASGEALMTACGDAYLAEILTMGRQYDAAERAARAALELVHDRSHEVRALAQASLARVLLATRREREALEIARQAYSLLPGSVGVGAEAPVRLALAEALRANGEETSALEAVRAARDRLVDRAAKIASPELRRSFLERVPANARTLRLAREWEGAY